ncbi:MULTISPECIES: YjbH domain-containing protein [unclassified Paracoccus (in: a-proteobacteria)]|uniref:YjbH domain-containing protein n=1 Tax=unclassified Paracoccus (in: a-proteobacteria) TaxID=2688777 RepID=UPI0012B352AF|nr:MULTISPECIES: YjbH domain-containing protein [unclassified Paracoccus (in: a-proteobacteria)]UXU75001.1 YjbH domain-containing protein [Paracoccus sp. SMMA_5]UXU80904.1 YjbH domain-containing protein [Paracoccus sp. SMMA_5_TC]
MRAHSTTTRRLLATTVPMALLLGLGATPARTDPMIGNVMNSYGLPGAVETPTAEMLPDATLGGTVSANGLGRRHNIVFQLHPRVTTALRYSRVEGINDHNNLGHIWDRSFDIRFQVLDESGWRPAVAVGLQDFMGTGVYSGEYIVASKTLTPNLRASLGVGWGRLAGKQRPLDADDEGGTPNIGDWFSGDARPFGSVTWQVNDKLRLVAEYSNDKYERETASGVEEAPGNQVNLGAYYTFSPSYQLGVYTLGGDKVGAQFSFALNPRNAPFPSGLEKAPAPVRPRPAPAADPDGWSGAWSADPTAQPAIQTALAKALAEEGQVLESMALSANRAEVRIRNTRYIQQAEAVGRTARLMTRALPPSVETLVITSNAEGMATSSVVLRRSDVERLENTEAGRIAAVALVQDAAPRPDDLVTTPGLFPRFRWKLAPYLELGLFDPQDPLRYETGAELKASYELVPGLVLSGTVRQRAFGSLEQRGPGIPCGPGGVPPAGVDRCGRGEHFTPDEYVANPQNEFYKGVPRVRSDTRMYAGNDSPTIPELTLAWYAHPSQSIYTRVTVGLLERAYGGVSGEVLWKPADSPLAFGAEINRVRKRDFEDVFGFRDYEVTTGHVSAYYEFANGFTAQLDVGKYLAGDKGATVTLTREFANGWRIGAYATKTDLSAEEFGEGSFDKGITMSIPVSWATGTPTRDRAGTTLRSLSRDGGARVNVNGRLYDKVRDAQSVKLYQGWGDFWR